MNILTVSFSYFRYNFWSSFFNIIVIAVGMALITIFLILNDQISKKLINDSKNIDGVIGAKGSSLQIALSTIWHVDIPTGNISYKDFDEISKNKLIKKAIPISLGDSFKKYRIVGSNINFFDFYQLKLDSGKLWSDDFQAVIGWQVAKAENLKIGDHFYSSHGLNLNGHLHDNQKFIVSAILQKDNSVIDRLVITSLKTIWNLHHDHNESKNDKHQHQHQSHNHDDCDHDNQITAILLQFKNKISALPFAQTINQNTNMQFASPSLEIVKLFKLVGVGSKSIKLFIFMMIGLSLISLLLVMLNSINQRKYDLAVFRSLGASRKKIFLLIIIESLIISLIASSIGLATGHLMVEILANISSQAENVGLNGFVIVKEIFFIWLIFIIFAILTSLIPAIKAYKIDIKKILTNE